jgi:hypothetical protein
MKIQQKFIFAMAAIIFAALQPVRANAQGASAQSDLHVPYGLQPAAQDANETSQETEARPVMSKLLPGDSNPVNLSSHALRLRC